MNHYPVFLTASILSNTVETFQLTVDKDGHSYFATLEIKNVTVEDAGKYKVTAKNELGESNATISLNFDSKYNRKSAHFFAIHVLEHSMAPVYICSIRSDIGSTSRSRHRKKYKEIYFSFFRS